MSRKIAILWKQSIKYFFIIVAFLTFFMLARFLWGLEDSVQNTILIIGSIIIVVGFVFDAWTVKDVIPYIKG